MKRGRNLFDLKPARNLTWETGEQELVVLTVPKFRNRLLAKLLLPRLKKREYRVKLDDVGSFIWNSCDGQLTVLEIADRVAKKFGGDADALYARVADFFKKLAREEFVVLR